KLGGAQYVVFVNELGATLNLFAQGQVVWQAGLLNAGTVEVQGFSSGTTLTLSGGEGRALVNQYLNAGVYKADGSGDTVEFASGSFLVVPGGSTGGVLLVSGRSEERRVGKECRERWVAEGANRYSRTGTGGKLMLGGESCG